VTSTHYDTELCVPMRKITIKPSTVEYLPNLSPQGD